MANYRTVVEREGDEMPRVRKVLLAEGYVESWGGDWPGPERLEQIADAYEVRWFAGFREGWRRALAQARHRSRLFALEVA